MAAIENIGGGAVLAFRSGAITDDDVLLRSVDGREKLSRLYEFDLLLERSTPYTEAEIKDLLKAPCAIALGLADGETLHGILASIELLDMTSTSTARYRARLVPNVWLLTLARTDRFFQKIKVPVLVERVLSLYGLVKGKDFEIAAWNKSPSREYVVQYQETDWDFIQRWLEHEGYFYFFEHGQDGEKLVILHESSACPPIPGEHIIPFRDKNNLGANRGTAFDWTVKEQRVTARVLLSDYNYRRPANRVTAKADADVGDGFGSVTLYGEHVKDQDEAGALATIRAQRIAVEKKVASASTDCSRVRVGHTFELENHFMADQDGEYLITSIEHRAGFRQETQRNELYRAKIEAIRKEVPFRPERATPWPRVRGLMHAHVDAEGSGAYAELDDLGRYRVKLPFGGSAAGGGPTSHHWIRMGQHYSGPSYGTHFPLHKGAEVILGHVDGNPDRPIIVAAIPNPATLSPSTSRNATQSVIHTASAIRIEMEDLQK